MKENVIVYVLQGKLGEAKLAAVTDLLTDRVYDKQGYIFIIWSG